MNLERESPARTTILLVRRAREGDEKARDALYERCAPRLAAWAHRRLPPKLRGARETADLVQDVMVDFITRVDQIPLRDDGAVQGYLRASLWSRIYHLIKSAEGQATRVGLHEDGAGQLSSSGRSPTQELVELEVFERYEAALATLSERDRTAVILRIDLQYDNQEIAEAMGFPNRSTAQRFVHRAIDKVVLLIKPSDLADLTGKS